jgi:thymidylate synthase
VRIFKNHREAMSEVERDLYEMGIRVHPETMQNKDIRDDDDYQTLELMGYSYMIQGPFDNEERLEMLRRSVGPAGVHYCLTEIQDRFSAFTLNPGNAWEQRPSVWREFLNEYGRFCYTYNERMGGPRISRLLKLIMENPGTRQAVLQIYQTEIDDQNRAGKKRVPCSMHYQLMVRNGALHLIYNMRSCDIHTHMPIDMALATMFLEQCAIRLGLKVGNFIHQIGSLHIYKKDAKEGVF